MMPDRLLTVQDVADYRRMPERFVEQQISLGYLDAVVIGTDWRIEPSALVAYVEARRTMTPLLEVDIEAG